MLGTHGRGNSTRNHAIRFSDPAGKRWPRLRLILFGVAIVSFLATVLFVQTLFVAPRLNLPISLRQLKGQLKSLQKRIRPARPRATLRSGKNFKPRALPRRSNQLRLRPFPARPHKKLPDNEVRLAFYTNGDPYSYASLEQHVAQLTHVCPEWMAVINGRGDLQIDADPRLPKFTASKGLALMPLLTNLVGDAWQPEAVENLAHGPQDRQDRLIQKVLAVLNEAKAAGMIVDWEQIDPVYKKDIAVFLESID